MRLLLGVTRWAAYMVGWFGGWAALGAVLTWRSFRQNPPPADWQAIQAGQRLLLTYREAGGSA